MSTSLDSTYGAAFIGVIVAAVLYGIACVQTLYYFTNHNDPWQFKLMVTAVMIFDTVHQALISHTAYVYDITDWGDPAQLGRVVWSLVAEIAFAGTTAFIIQSFLTMRIWRLSGRNIYLTAISAMLVAGGFVTILTTLAMLSQLAYLSQFDKLKGIFISVNALHAAADLLISATLCALLNISRTGFHSSGVIINRLIFLTVNTGLLTSFCALASLITLLAASTTFINIAFFFCLPRLYTNTLLATLNARNHIRDVTSIEESSGMPISFRDVSKTGPNQSQNLMSISIDTTIQKHRDQKLDEENSAVSRY